jgi:hypothetical protein
LGIVDNVMQFATGSAILVLGAVAGYISAQQALGRAGLAPVVDEPYWQRVVVNPKDPYAVYAIGHFQVEGFLPPPTSANVFVRKVDDDGNSLRSECAYKLLGAAPQSRWWIVKLGNSSDDGNVLSARDAILSGTDQLQIGIAKRPTPGNWLVMPQLGNLQLSLVMNEPYPLVKNAKPAPLPALKKLECE